MHFCRALPPAHLIERCDALLAVGGGGGRALPPSRWKAGTVPMRETCRAPPPPQRTLPSTGQPENCSAGGGGGLTWTHAEGGGGVGEMGFRVGPFVLCKNGCWRQRHRNTKFGPKKFFPAIIPPPPPHLSSQNDQRDVGIILSHRCWVEPPPPPARQVGHPRPEPPPPVTAAKEGGGRVGKMGFRVNPPPPPAEQFSSRPDTCQVTGAATGRIGSM